MAGDRVSGNRCWLGADLVVEVMSEDDHEGDTVEKVGDYAEAMQQGAPWPSEEPSAPGG